MKAAPFHYVRPEFLAHALDVLAEHGGDAKPVAGGQSLVPMMAMRLARPAVLVDIYRLDELQHVEAGIGSVTLGAGVRQRKVEHDGALHEALPLVRDALRWVGHEQTRNRGTVGGSLVHADPSAELPLAAVVLDAQLRLASRDGERHVAASEFFLGPMTTATGEDECLVDIRWPVWAGDGIATVFDETAMRHGDFAMASAACQLQLAEDGTCRRAALGLGGVDGVPRAFPDLAARLVGQRIDARLADEVADAAARDTEPGEDLHADPAYRRHLARVLMSRALQRAAAAARPSYA